MQNKAASNSHRFTRSARLILWLIPLAFMGIFYFFPLGKITRLSFSREEASLWEGIRETLSSPTILRVIGFTFKQAALSTLLTLVVGLPGAYLFGRFNFRGKKLLRALTGVPFVMPTLVVAAGFYALLGPTGWVNSRSMDALGLINPPIQFVNTFGAILTAHVFYNITIVLRVVGDYWSRLDRRLESAARVLGAGRWATLKEVTLPLLSPALAAASLLIFIFDFTSFGVVLVLGGPTFATLEVEIYYQTISLFNLPVAATLSLLQVGFTLILTIIYTRLTARIQKPAQLSSRGRTQHPLASRRSRLLAGLFIAALLIFLLSPLAALVGKSVTSSDPGAALTLAFYRSLASRPREFLFYVPPSTALGVSLSYGMITVLLALALGLPAAWSLSKKDLTIIDKIIDPVLMLPLGTSAVTLGLGFLVALDQPPLNLRTSPLLVPIAHTLVAFPFVVRSLTPALASIQPKLRQAAAMLGASPRQVLREIDLPLVGRAIIVAASFAFTISIGEFGASSLITRPEYPTVPIVIYRLLGRPGSLNYGQAMALSSILMAATLTGMLLMEYFRVGEAGEF